ncbi:MAG TPA: hypothetical protein VE687_01520 [Stellaceae bacterium]|nr:hypothetical protein [Stellaceae bacterium]
MVARWVSLTALYIAFAGQTSAAEIIAGLLTGVIAAGFSLLLRAGAERRFQLRAPWVSLAPRLARALLHDTGVVAAALARGAFAGHRGQVIRQPFAEAGDNMQGAGRRALATLFASVAPNGFVLDFGRNSFDVHRLAPAPAATDREWAV